MELLLILIYVSICYAVFKVFRIPVNQWSLSTAALGGIIGIALLLLIMNYNHPFTTNARIYFAVTPVLPSVRGQYSIVSASPGANVVFDQPRRASTLGEPFSNAYRSKPFCAELGT